MAGRPSTINLRGHRGLDTRFNEEPALRVERHNLPIQVMKHLGGWEEGRASPMDEAEIRCLDALFRVTQLKVELNRWFSFQEGEGRRAEGRASSVPAGSG